MQRSFTLGITAGARAVGAGTQTKVVKISRTSVFLFFIALVSARFSNGQRLDGNCVVSILNRSVQVGADGSWTLPDVPANLGSVRARATCIQNGATTFGQSDLFTIQPNLMNAIPNITLGNTTPIPTSLAITAPSTSLTSSGATTQLTVTASYNGSPNQDVTASTTGTQYTISNPAIATISPNGLVTAVGSGTAFIQAVNEGAQGLTNIQVILGSSHGGIPDSWALANGLDPNDPTMPMQDPDHDGLTNLQEFQNGTDPHNPDTDGDGLTDGQEVLMYHTNPALVSTDGTGIPDGIEVKTGTLGGTLSAKLAAALASVEIKPAKFILAVNTLNPSISQQLDVVGHLIDGKTTYDLTSTTTGTTYATSDATICNFGAPDGNIFAGNAGSCIITVKTNGFTAQAQGIVTNFTPTALSQVSIPGYANMVAVNGNYAYIAAGSTGLQVVDVSNRSQPKVVASQATPGNADDIEVVGTLAFISDDSAGLQIIDISNPLKPSLIGAYKTPGVAWHTAVSNGIAYVADGSSGLQIVDVENPSLHSPWALSPFREPLKVWMSMVHVIW